MHYKIVKRISVFKLNHAENDLERSIALQLKFRMRFAQTRVLYSSIATVIGPTPPGTGVIADATFMASSWHTSPTRR